MRFMWMSMLLVACAGHAGEERGALCDDGADNDGDGLFDCDDKGCARAAACVDDGWSGAGIGPGPGTGTGTGGDSGYPTWGTGTGTGTGTGGTSTFSIMVVWTDDGGLPYDGSCDDRVDTFITDPLGVTSWFLGMAETGSPNGWTGEDCLNGYGGYSFCHPIGLVGSLDEVSDCAPGSVVEGVSTLFDAEKDPFLTYFFQDAFGACFVFGEDPAYYAALGCTEMM